MSTCTKWVNQLVITCKNWTSMIDYECTSWADEGSNQCSQWSDEGSNQCAQWSDEGSSQCSQWADEGHDECSSWSEDCHWYTFWNCIVEWICNGWYWVANLVCQAWYWVANLVCQAWYWVANLVCQAWYWVAKWVCKAFAWVIKAICVVFSWALSLICVAWDTLRCALLNLKKLITPIFFKNKGNKSKIKHVFVLMLENRAFDHMLGFSGITGNDINGQPTSIEGINPLVNKNINPVNGQDVFVSTPADFYLKNVDVDPGHEFEHTLTSLCGAGAIYNPVPGGYPTINNSGFIENYIENNASSPDRIMSCFTPQQLPILNTLAKEFAVCDNWFSSLPGPTFPNRFFLLAGTSGGLDNSPGKLDIVSGTTVEGYRFENGNIFDLLDDYCIDWKIFEGDDFPVSFVLNGMNLNAFQGRFKDFDDFETEINKIGLSEKFIFIEPKYGSHKFDITGPGDFACGNSMHPLDDVIRGEKLIKKVYETIRNSPHWEESMLIITFDEHGGFYDHMPPPSAVPPGDLITNNYRKKYPDGHPQAGQLINFQFDQLGVRVPAIIISPYIKKGVIDHTTYDHTSMLATIERIYGLNNLTERDRLANDFIHLFSLDSPRTDTPTILPDAATNPNPLDCEEDDETEDGLLLKRSELKISKKEGIYKERRINDYKITPSQVGFIQIALLKVLQTAEYPERIQWIEQYKEINTGIDAAIFMTEAKLKVKFSIDLKKNR